MSNLNLTKDELHRLQLDHDIMCMELNIDLIVDIWQDEDERSEGYETIDQMRDEYRAELERLVQEKEDLLLKIRTEDPIAKLAYERKQMEHQLVMDALTKSNNPLIMAALSRK